MVWLWVIAPGAILISSGVLYFFYKFNSGESGKTSTSTGVTDEKLPNQAPKNDKIQSKDIPKKKESVLYDTVKKVINTDVQNSLESNKATKSSVYVQR